MVSEFLWLQALISILSPYNQLLLLLLKVTANSRSSPASLEAQPRTSHSQEWTLPPSSPGKWNPQAQSHPPAFHPTAATFPQESAFQTHLPPLGPHFISWTLPHLYLNLSSSLPTVSSFAYKHIQVAPVIWNKKQKNIYLESLSPLFPYPLQLRSQPLSSPHHISS